MILPKTTLNMLGLSLSINSEFQDLMSVLSHMLNPWLQRDVRESAVWLVQGVRKLEPYERSSMECQILKCSTSRSMQLVAVALMATGAIPIFNAERATGQVFLVFFKAIGINVPPCFVQSLCNKAFRFLCGFFWMKHWKIEHHVPPQAFRSRSGISEYPRGKFMVRYMLSKAITHGISRWTNIKVVL